MIAKYLNRKTDIFSVTLLHFEYSDDGNIYLDEYIKAKVAKYREQILQIKKIY